ncbi:MAG TPA: helix-turn-helix transcriptional regulator [Armatimonadota bacterium]|jgi:transcriptional regulator with XRE-family HTH domain
MDKDRSHTTENPRPTANRIAAVMEHTTRYAFKGKARLATDAGISKSAVSRLLSGTSSPSAMVLIAVTRALERATGKHLDPREILSFDGTYPTPSVCRLVDCRGCLPASAYDSDDTIRPEYRHAKPGEWTGEPSRNGQTARKGGA